MPTMLYDRRPSGHYDVLDDPPRTYAEISADQDQATSAAASDDLYYLKVTPGEDYSSYLTVLPGSEETHT